MHLNEISTYSKGQWFQVIHKSPVPFFTVCRDQLLLNYFLFTCDLGKPRDFQPTRSGLRAPHFPFIQERTLRTNIRWVKPTREISLQMQNRDVLQEKLLWEGKTRHWAAPALPDAPAPRQHPLRQPGVLVCCSPCLRQENGSRDPHPPGLPSSLLT